MGDYSIASAEVGIYVKIVCVQSDNQQSIQCDERGAVHAACVSVPSYKGPQNLDFASDYHSVDKSWDCGVCIQEICCSDCS